MFDEPQYPRGNRRAYRKAGNTTTVLVVVVALGVILLGLVLLAANQSNVNQFAPGNDDPDTVTNNESANRGVVATSTPQPVTAAEIAARRQQARTELAAIQTRFEADQNYEAAVTATNELEADLEGLYANASSEVRADWQRTKVEFDRFEEALRNESADAMNVLAGLILLLEDEVRTDEGE